MKKIIQFVDENIPFVRDSYHQAVKDLPLIDPSIEVISKTYQQLKNNEGFFSKYYSIDGDLDDCILFLEAGQLQEKHSGWNLKTFKIWFPYSKIVVWSSDLMYYILHGYEHQFDNPNEVDFVFECTPTLNDYWSDMNVPSVTIPWTISFRLYEQLRKLAGSLDFKRKKTDLVCLANFDGNYRTKLAETCLQRGYNIERGGDHYDKNLAQTYEKYLNGWFTLGTTSHVRPELNDLNNRTMKGYRDAVGIALNCLLIYDDDPMIDQVWTLGKTLPRYTFDNFESIFELCDFYKDNLVLYAKLLKEQQKWLENHLADRCIYNNLKKYKIL